MTPEEIFDRFIDVLKRRSLKGENEKSSLELMRKKYSDLDFYEATYLCNQIHSKSLETYLMEIGLINLDQSNEISEDISNESDELENIEQLELDLIDYSKPFICSNTKLSSLKRRDNDELFIHKSKDTYATGYFLENNCFVVLAGSLVSIKQKKSCSLVTVRTRRTFDALISKDGILKNNIVFPSRFKASCFCSFAETTGFVIAKNKKSDFEKQVKNSNVLESIVQPTSSEKETILTYSKPVFRLCDLTSVVYDSNVIATIQCDVENYEKYTKERSLVYGLEYAYRYIRTLYRGDFSKSLMGISYAESLITHGIITRKNKDYWKDLLLGYLKKHYIECSGEMFTFSQSAFEYDAVRKCFKISTPIYDGNKRLTDVQVVEKYTGGLSIKPCYSDEIYAMNAAIVSNDTIIGYMNKTLFSSKGLGMYMAPLLIRDDIILKRIKLSNDNYPFVYFEFEI